MAKLKTITRRAALLGGGAVIGGWAVKTWSPSNPTLYGTRQRAFG